MQTDGPVGIAERFECRDLFPLRGNDPRHDHIQQERRHRKKDHRHDAGHVSQLLDLVREEAIGNLVVTAVGPQAAVVLGQQVETTNDFGLACFGHQRQRHVVERAVHVEGGGQRLVIHPEDAESQFVGKDVAGANLIDVLGRQRHSDEFQLFPPAIDDRLHPIAGLSRAPRQSLR